MDTVSLMEKLLQIERAIGEKEAVTLRAMILDAQECVLHMQREFVCTLHARARVIEQPRAFRI